MLVEDDALLAEEDMDPRLACLLLAMVGAACAAGLRTSDRGLHVRSIPGVDGWNSPLFEVHMPPYAFESPPLTATARLMAGGGGSAEGELWLMQVAPPAGPTRIWGRVKGLPPGARVSLQAHVYGDTREACNATGPPLYPDVLTFGSPLDWQLHGGAALGNAALGSALMTDASGELPVEIWDPVLSLGGMRGVAGRALVLHAVEEATRSEPSWGPMKPGLACAVVALSPLPEQAYAPPPGSMQGPGSAGGPMGGPGSMQGPGPMSDSGQMGGAMPDGAEQKEVENVPAEEIKEDVAADDVPMTTPMAA